MTPSEKIQQTTALSNKYRREAQAHGIGSPFRQSLYIKARLKGLSEELATHKAKTCEKI